MKSRILKYASIFSTVEKVAIAISVSIVIITIILPIIVAILWALVSPDVAWSYPNVLPEKLGFGRWVYLWKFSSMKTSLIHSYTVAPVVAVLAVILSFSSAYVLGRYKFKTNNLIRLIILSPMLLPGIPVAMFFAQLVNNLGIRSPFWGIVIGHTIIKLPISITILSSAFSRIPQEQIDAARDLGANKIKTFMTAYYPIIRPAVFVTLIYDFIKSVEEFNISFILGSPNFTTVPTILFGYLGYNFVRPNAAIVSLILMVPNLIVMLSIEKALSANKIVGTGLKG